MSIQVQRTSNAFSVLFVVALVGFLGWKKWHKPVIFANRLLVAGNGEGAEAEDPCLAKPRCLIIYTAPWCPACRRAAPVMKEVRYRLSGSNKVGVKAVVGLDEREKLETYAAELGGTVFLDEDRTLYKQAGQPGIPAFLVLDERGRMIERESGAYPEADVELEHLQLDTLSLASVRAGR